MIDTGYATLNQRPKAFNTVGVNIPVDIDFGMMVNPLMPVTHSGHSVVGGELISIEDGLARYLLVNKGNDGVALNIGGNLGNNLSASLDSADDFRFPLCATPTLALALTTYISFVNLYLTIEVSNILTKQGSNLVEHAPSCFISNTHLSLDLLGRDTTSSRSHAVDSLKPCSQRRGGFVEYSARSGINLMPAVIALIARATSNLVVLRYLVALGAVDTPRPAMLLNPLKAGLIGREFLVEICKRIFLHFSPLNYAYIIAGNLHVVKG